MNVPVALIIIKLVHGLGALVGLFYSCSIIIISLFETHFIKLVQGLGLGPVSVMDSLQGIWFRL